MELVQTQFITMMFWQIRNQNRKFNSAFANIIFKIGKSTSLSISRKMQSTATHYFYKSLCNFYKLLHKITVVLRNALLYKTSDYSFSKLKPLLFT
jgi:hypothetical protein